MKFAVCPYTNTIENGKVSVNEDRAVPGTTITYRCNTNFALSTINSDFVCGENGSWTDFDTVPTCVSSTILLFLMFFEFFQEVN